VEWLWGYWYDSNNDEWAIKMVAMGDFCRQERIDSIKNSIEI